MTCRLGQVISSHLIVRAKVKKQLLAIVMTIFAWMRKFAQALISMGTLDLVHQSQVMLFAQPNTHSKINSPMIAESPDLKPFSADVMILFV